MVLWFTRIAICRGGATPLSSTGDSNTSPILKQHSPRSIHDSRRTEAYVLCYFSKHEVCHFTDTQHSRWAPSHCLTHVKSVILAFLLRSPSLTWKVGSCLVPQVHSSTTVILAIKPLRKALRTRVATVRHRRDLRLSVYERNLVPVTNETV